MKSQQQFIIPEPVTPDRFCDFWIPKLLTNGKYRSEFRLLGLSESEAGYKAERVRFLQRLIEGKKNSTIYKWLNNPSGCPLEVCLFLGALHITWNQTITRN
ncbi:hypothetical protein PN499_23110 [Kamptonema animale CS-326]|jgi:hypothetical protein|uniref:hypothetical protein n=1 Tax=Kamptonema animale TaxID=92934 RepID=UPI00232CC0D1|nr:hypothetical protein [Kamptonema animale]MDB9514094.1 hypothetical protein [Kamptonema animale CS-326]HLO49370.1 hypothetical protein [Kamptonema sp.]